MTQDEVGRLVARLKPLSHYIEIEEAAQALQAQQAEITRYREVLEFYAAGHDDSAVDDFEPYPEQPFKRGARARAALEPPQ